MKKELERIVTTQEPNILDIRFWPTDICNFNCDYCFPGSVLNKNLYPKNVDTVIKNFRLLFDEYSRSHGKDVVEMNIAGGGEPALWPHLSYFTKEIQKEHTVRLKMTTNGSRKLQWWKDNTQHIDKFTMSCHHKEIDIDNFIEVCDYLWERGSDVTALMLMDAKHWDKCVSYIDRMKENSKYPWLIQAKEVVDAPGMDFACYTPEQVAFFNQPIKRAPSSDWIIENLHRFRLHESIAMYNDGTVTPALPNHYIVTDANQFKGWECSVAIENLVVTHDGTITGSCQEQVFKNANLNLFSETFEEEFNREKLTLSTIICPRNCCSCQPDTHISKRKI